MGSIFVFLTVGRIYIIHSVGFSAASEGTYPTKVNLVIPETVGDNIVVWALNERLRSL